MKNIELINASAGSGKTYNLTSRIVNVIDDGVSPEKLMATTFTKRAAAELKERIRIDLLKNRKTEEANRINDSFIGTVNGVCDRLLREYAVEAGISPAAEVMPEEESANIFKISIDSVIDKYAANMEAAAGRMGLDGSGSGYQKTDDWRNHVKRIVDYARSNKMDSEILKKCSESSWLTMKEILGEPSQNDLDKEIEKAVVLAIDNLTEYGNLKVKLSSDALNYLKECKRNIDNNNLRWSEWVKLSKLAPAANDKNYVSNVTALAGNVLSHSKLQDDIRHIIEGSFNCAIEALEYYDEYKKSHGMVDFIDQESKVLSMLKTNQSFCQSLSERINALMVDEFQDTSPIQLALFLAMNEITGKSVWVGDPKQAIYGFRGTDPQLMEQVVNTLESSIVLDYSWRSKENLVNFTNALFSEVFSYMGRDKVCLKIPKERETKAKGGDIELWHISEKNNTDEYHATANGVRNLIERRNIKPGDIAVLCRQNDGCSLIASFLEAQGIRASVGQGLLVGTKECRIALAALRYMNDKNDTVALAEIIKMKNNESDEWFTELVANMDETLAKWNAEEFIAKLEDGRDHIKYWTPLEALEQAINRIDLLEDIKCLPNSSLAISNLDTLRGACNEYMDNCDFNGSAPSVGGFIYYMQNSDKKQAKGSGEGTVNVLTYHGSKGLEWPWVVLSDLDNKPRTDIFGVNMEPAKEFKVEDPLANRNIRYWPWPFGSQKKFDLIDSIIDSLPVRAIETKKAESEEQRLMYVGMTRARNGLVLAVRKHTTKKSIDLKTGWLDIMKNEKGNKAISLSLDTNIQEILAGSSKIPVSIFEYIWDDPNVALYNSEEKEYMPDIKLMDKSYPPARLSPSSLEATDETDKKIWEIIDSSNFYIKIKGKPEMDALGNAVHAYLSLDYANLNDDEQLIAAERILKNWGMDSFIDALDVLKAGNNFQKYIDERYDNYKIFKEWPIFIRNEDNQVIQGWIDMLLETEKGYVLIDHKDYPGSNPEERAKQYTPQLSAYKEAVEKSTSKPVIEILIHMPVKGIVLKLQEEENLVGAL